MLGTPTTGRLSRCNREGSASRADFARGGLFDIQEWSLLVHAFDGLSGVGVDGGGGGRREAPRLVFIAPNRDAAGIALRFGLGGASLGFEGQLILARANRSPESASLSKSISVLCWTQTLALGFPSGQSKIEGCCD